MKSEYTVLIVDDEPVGRETLEALLLKEGYNLILAGNGVEALAVIAKSQPDVVLLDVMMPELDGFEVCRRLRADPVLAEIPVILITALDDQNSRLQGIEAGADDFLTKPCNRLELRARVRNIVRLNRYRRLVDARSKFEQLFNLSPDGILVVDLSGRIQVANPAMAEFAGVAGVGDIVGKKIMDFIAPDQWVACGSSLHQVLGGAAGKARVEAGFVRANGTRFPAEITLGAVEWNGETRAQVIIRDITDRMEKNLLEAKYMRAQRLESIGTLASGIAHDLNNVLTPILMSVEMLKTRIKDPKGASVLASLEKSALRGAGIIKQVLAFGRGAEGEHNLMQPKYLLREIIQIAGATFPKSIEVKDDLAKDLWPILGDSTQLHQVLLNLSVNARDAMPNGGSMTITATNIELDAAFSSMHPEAKPGPYIMIEVVDTGVGIPPAIREKIFDPFFTTKEVGKGTGLGLSTVMGIVKKHGGFLQIASEVGNGTQFRVYLPASLSDTLVSDGVASAPLPQGQGELVLIADDESAIAEVLRETLEQNRYRVIEARDGAETVALFALHRAEIKAVVLDFMMPVMDGAAAVQVLHYISPKLPVVIMRGSPDENNALEQIIQASRAELISKPFTARDLLCALAAALKKVE